HGNGEDGKHHSGEKFRVRPIAPEGDQVEVGRVEHQFDADQNEDGATPRERAGEADGEEQRGDEEISRKRRHLLLAFSCMATMTAPIVAAVSSTAIISSGST